MYVDEWFRGPQAPAGAVWAALLFGLAIVYVLWKSFHNYRKLAEVPPAPAGFEPDVTVVIPARNEARNIGEAVRSFPVERVLVVDDDSSDETAERAREAGAAVIPAPPLRTHQRGKPNACWAGARQAHTRWILFADADTRYEPGALAALVHYAESRRLDGVSMLLRQERVTISERMILPYASALYFCGVSGRQLNRTRGSDTLANGQCFLVRREAYEQAGGHNAVAESVIEDVALARVMKYHGRRLRVVRGEHLGWVRMYDGFPAIWRGFQKNAFRFLIISPWTGVQVMLSSLILASWLPVLVWLLMSTHWPAALLLALLPAVMLRGWYGGWREALLTLPAIYVFQAIAFSGVYHTSFGGPSDWKGRPV